MPLVDLDRVKNILVKPRQEWAVIDAEPTVPVGTGFDPDPCSRAAERLWNDGLACQGDGSGPRTMEAVPGRR